MESPPNHVARWGGSKRTDGRFCVSIPRRVPGKSIVSVNHEDIRCSVRDPRRKSDSVVLFDVVHKMGERRTVVRALCESQESRGHNKKKMNRHYYSLVLQKCNRRWMKDRARARCTTGTRKCAIGRVTDLRTRPRLMTSTDRNDAGTFEGFAEVSVYRGVVSVWREGVHV